MPIDRLAKVLKRPLFPQPFWQCVGPCGNCTCAKTDDDITRLRVGAHQLFQVVFIQKRAGVTVAVADQPCDQIITTCPLNRVFASGEHFGNGDHVSLIKTGAKIFEQGMQARVAVGLM